MNQHPQPQGSALAGPTTAPAPHRAPRWRRSALAMAAAFVLGGASLQAYALGLGRLHVLSAIGQPLRAEIEIPQATAEEIGSLRASIGDAAAFRTAGAELHPLIAAAQITLQRRPDGSHYLRITGDRPVMEPFLELVLDATWASGRILRGYTMLIDPPPSTRPAQPLIAAQVPAAPAAGGAAQAGRPAASAGAVSSPVTGAAVRERPIATAPAAAPAPAPAPGNTQAAPRPAPTGERTVTVQPGDSASRIAARHRPAAVSLDQMLIALLTGNPSAFSENNVNRLRAGAVLQLPTEEQAAATSEAQARQMVVAQSRDFNEFRRRLAEGVPSTPGAEAGRSDAGRVTAQVQERAAAPSPDRLTLAKGGVRGASAAPGAEDQLARSRAAQDDATRVAELSRNIAELNRLSGATAAPAAAAATSTTGSSAGTAPAPADAGATAAPGAAIAASAAAPSVAPAITAATPAAATAASAPAPSARAADAGADATFLDDVLANPYAMAGGGAVVALLLAAGLMRLRRRRKSAGVDSSFLESRLQPDSFFGASGGQRIDTAEGASVTGSSMVYSPSQLDAAGDVDPVAEADVYLAYGRDLQAEEILKEALRTSPKRLAIHQKLLEIHARRRDVTAFEQSARQVRALTNGEGPVWLQVCTLGAELEPGNPMYQGAIPAAGVGVGATGGITGPAAGAAAVAALGTMPIARHAEASQTLQPAHDDFTDTGEITRAPEVPASTKPPALDLDLDLDFDLSGTPAAEAAAPGDAPAPAKLTDEDKIALALATLVDEQPPLADAPSPAPAEGTPEPVGNELNFDLDTLDALDTLQPDSSASAAYAADVAIAQASAPDLAGDLPADLALDLSAFDAPGAPVAPAAPAAADEAPASLSASGASDSLMDFDLGSLALEADAPASRLPQAPATQSSQLPELDLDHLDDIATTANGEDDPLATKLALAEEFKAIGDADGARSLAQEVLAEASGELRQQAQRLLAEIG